MARAMHTSEDNIADSLTGSVDSLEPGGAWQVPVTRADFRCRCMQTKKVLKIETEAGENPVMSKPPTEDDG